MVSEDSIYTPVDLLTPAGSNFRIASQSTHLLVTVYQPYFTVLQMTKPGDDSLSLVLLTLLSAAPNSGCQVVAFRVLLTRCSLLTNRADAVSDRFT
jgi:hypothetical protein